MKVWSVLKFDIPIRIFVDEFDMNSSDDTDRARDFVDVRRRNEDGTF